MVCSTSILPGLDTIKITYVFIYLNWYNYHIQKWYILISELSLVARVMESQSYLRTFCLACM